ncbi:putative reverse transcriptase domain-containing protein [Tanacetum coccineum]
MLDSEDSMVTYTEALLSPDYVPGPERPHSPICVPYVPEPVYPKFMPLEDDVLPAEEQPLLIHQEEDKDEEEEEHLASVDSVPLPTCRTTARMSIRDQTPIPFLAAVIWLKAESPSTSHPLPLLSPILLPHTRASVAMMRVAAPSTYILAPRSGILLSETPPSGTPPLLPIPLPTPLPPLLLPSTVCRAGVSEVGESSSAPTARPTGGFRADYGFVGTLDDEIRRDPKREVGYGITDTWDEMVEDIHGTLTATDVAGLSHRMTDFVTTIRQDTDEIYGRLDDALDDRSLMSGQLNKLRRDRCAHACTARLMESDARLSREAWVQSMDASDTTHSETQMTVLQKNGTKRTIRSTPATITTPTTFVTDEQLKRLIDQGVADALAARNADSCQNGEDSHDSGTGVRRSCRVTQWFERMETVFRISSYSVENQINFSTCTLLESALTWWNSHVKTFGHDVAYAMTWTNLKKKMTDKYCLTGEELALMCARIFPKESDKIEKYIGGLPDMIHRSVMASKPKTMPDAIEFATELMEKKIRTFAERQSENKRKQDDNQQLQQQQNKRQNTGRVYAAGSGEEKPCGGSKPLCSKCNYHHDGQCAPKCHKCNRVGHLARDCRSTTNSNTTNNQRGTWAGQKPTCFECGAQGHFKRECPKLKNNNRGNQGGHGNSPEKVYAVGRAGTNLDSNIVTGTFLLNNRYASILFDTGADRSFVSTTFSS